MTSDPHLLMVKAVKPPTNSPQFMENLKTSMPQIKAAESQLGKPIENLDDLLAAIKIAKKNTWAKVESTYPQGDAPNIDNSSVADQMESTITDRMNGQNPGLADSIRQRANYYRKPGGFSLQDTETALQEVNDELNSYYAKNPGAQRVAQGRNPDVAALVAEGNQLRDNLYDYLDTYGTPGARDLKRQYGTLTELQQAAYKRRNVWLRQARAGLADQAADLLSARLGARAIVNAFTGNIPGAIGDIAVGAASKVANSWLKDLNSTDGLIRRAFDGYSGTSATGVPSRARIVRSPGIPP